MNYLIKNLKYAKQLHRQAMKLDKDILKQKDFVISVIQKKNPQKKEINQAINYIKFWKETHENWIELIKINRKWVKYGGNINWQKKWIKIYQEMLDYLKSKK